MQTRFRMSLALSRVKVVNPPAETPIVVVSSYHILFSSSLALSLISVPFIPISSFRRSIAATQSHHGVTCLFTAAFRQDEDAAEALRDDSGSQFLTFPHRCVIINFSESQDCITCAHHCSSISTASSIQCVHQSFHIYA